MLPRKANSDLGLHCLCRLFWQASSVCNFRKFTVVSLISNLTTNWSSEKSSATADAGSAVA